MTQIAKSIEAEQTDAGPRAYFRIAIPALPFTRAYKKSAAERKKVTECEIRQLLQNEISESSKRATELTQDEKRQLRVHQNLRSALYGQSAKA